MVSIGLEKANKQKNMLKPQGFKQSVFALLLSTVAINILSLGLPVMTLQVYDRILPNPGTGTLPVLITGVCLAILCEAVLRLCRAYVIGRSGAAYEHRMACGAMKKVLGADLSQIEGYGIAEHLHRMSSVGRLKDFYNGHALIVMVELAFVPLFFGLIAYIGGLLALVPAVILSVFIMLSLWKGHRLRGFLKTREEADDKRFNFLIESLEGVHTLKAFALEKFFQRRYEALEEKSTQENYRLAQETARTFNIGAIFSHIMVASVISAGAWFVLQGMLTTGGLIATILLAGRMMQPIQKALGLWTRYQDYNIAKAHLENLFHTPQKVLKPRKNIDVAPSPAGRLKLRDVSFHYHENDTKIIRGLDLELNTGDSILISGGHGCGKTTLLNLIAGLYPARGGDVHIDGEDVNSYSAEELVKHVGYIRTSLLIFRGTIRDNITCFGQADEAQAREVARMLNLDKDVAKLSGGFDTFLSGNNTDSIPPGLKQRIAMVRVLATKPRLILFDDADRALDKDGYAMIYSLLARVKGKASLILVSDDQNIRSLADRHYVLKGGNLARTNEAQNTDNIHHYQEQRL